MLPPVLYVLEGVDNHADSHELSVDSVQAPLLLPIKLGEPEANSIPEELFALTRDPESEDGRDLLEGAHWALTPQGAPLRLPVCCQSNKILLDVSIARGSPSFNHPLPTTTHIVERRRERRALDNIGPDRGGQDHDDDKQERYGLAGGGSCDQRGIGELGEDLE